jgi:hypothetical protein
LGCCFAQATPILFSRKIIAWVMQHSSSERVVIALNLYHRLHRDCTTLGPNLHHFAQIEAQDNVAKGRECLLINLAISAKLEGNLFWKPNNVQ